MRKIIGLLLAVVLIVCLCQTNMSQAAKKKNTNKDVKTGDIITFGHYEQDGDLSNGKEPIEWIVLSIDNDNNKALLISKYALDYQRFCIEGNYNLSWEGSDLRKWLNNEFYNSGFGKKEQEYIILSEIWNFKAEGADGSKPNQWRRNPQPSTKDNIFVLSIDEVSSLMYSNGDSIDEKRLCLPTNYIKDLYNIENLYEDWWTRTEADVTLVVSTAVVGSSTGEISSDYTYSKGLVRPSLYINTAAIGMDFPVEVDVDNTDTNEKDIKENSDKNDADNDLKPTDNNKKTVVIYGESEHVYKGDKIQLMASDGDSRSDKNNSEWEWWSSYDEYAVVDQDGLVKILDDSGEVRIYARNINTDVTGSYKINYNRDNYNYEKKDSGFILGEDNNSFWHHNGVIKSVGEDGKEVIKHFKSEYEYLVGFLNQEHYLFSDSTLFDKLTKYSSESNKNDIEKKMNEDEWNGSCYGVSSSMALLKEGYLKFDDLSDIKQSSGNEKYYNLTRPCENSKLSDWINYLYLSQFLEKGGARAVCISKSIRVGAGDRSVLKGLLDGSADLYRNWNTDSEEEFFRKIVDYTADGHVNMLSFYYEYTDNEGKKHSGGHSVLITGCCYDENKKKYIVDIYDQNSNTGKIDTVKGSFSKMEIEKDFSGFKSYNWDSDTKKWVEWDALNYYYEALFADYNLIGQLIVNPNYFVDEHTHIEIPLHSSCDMVDSYGNTLFYDGESLTGSIKVLDFDIQNSDDELVMVIYTEPVEELKFTNLSKESNITVYTNDDYVSFSGTNIEEAQIDFGKYVELKGDNIEFKAYVSTNGDEANESKLIKVAGDASSDINISVNKSDITISSEGTIENIITAAFEGTAKVERAFTDATHEFKIDSDAKVKNATEIAMVRTDGVATIETAGDISILGVTKSINSNNIAQATVKFSKDTYAYNGKKKKPTVTVELGGKVLTASKDYKVSYKNNKNVGTATLTIKGIGDYNGTISRTFKIVPKATSLSKISASGETISVKWKKQTKSVTGYEIQYSTSKSFTKKTTETVTVAGAKKTKTTISGLKSGKKYYVRVRTYKVVNGKKYYSGWSKVKNVKVK